jgi:hypothetical protein
MELYNYFVFCLFVIFSALVKHTCAGVNNCGVGSSDFDIFYEIQYASCVFGLALKS